jgi:hypothetical protein
LNARADVAGDEAPDDATVTVVPLEDMLDVGDVVVTPTATAGEAASESEANRYQRLAEGVRGLRAGGGTLNLGERTLMILGGIIAPLGLIVIWIGWNGAAHSPFLFEQVPYLISGIGLGLGLVFLGAFFYFAHWITELVKEGRSQSAALLEAITRLEATVREQAGADRLAMADGVHTNGSTAVADADLVATGKGTMAHRPDCVVVVGKPDLRRVTADEGLVACKLCDPYETPVDA